MEFKKIKFLSKQNEYDDVYTFFFDKKDVVRHKLVQDIVNAYQKYEEDKNNGRS